MFLNFFIRKWMNQIYSITFSVSKISLMTFLAQLVSIFFIFGHFFPKSTFLRLWHFFSPSGFPINSVFQWQYVFIIFMFLMKHFSSPHYQNTKLFRAVTRCEELSFINMHDTSMEWSCGAIWQIKYISPPVEDVWTPN